jgi:hypothetical protein
MISLAGREPGPSRDIRAIGGGNHGGGSHRHLRLRDDATESRIQLVAEPGSPGRVWA